MCAIAEFRCAGLSLCWPLLPDVLEGFTVEVERGEGQAKLAVISFDGSCLCEPTDAVRQGLRAIAEDLCRHAAIVDYSPNDYSDNERECQRLEMTPRQAFWEHYPSLDTPPLRIRLFP